MIKNCMNKFDFNSPSLESYIDKNIKEIYDYFTLQNQKELFSRKNDLNKFIQSRRNEILDLDSTVNNNLTFISLIIDIAERLGLFSSFGYLYDHLLKSQFNVGKRIESASKFLINVKTKDDYIERLPEICRLLQDALESEEDSSDKILITFSNYYSQFVYHFGEFNPEATRELKSMIIETREEGKYSFLSNDFIDTLLQINEKINGAYDVIIQQIDTFLGSINNKSIAFYNTEDKCLIEKNTDYSILFDKVPANFDEIFKLSYVKYRMIKDDDIFRSLGRGVSILKTEEQLFAYLYSYGDMHSAKLREAFSILDYKEITPDLNIIDWGCGQAIGSMVLMDNFQSLEISKLIRKVILIEPSEICLKRASLHMSKYCPTTKITTINKEIDDLVDGDLHHELVGTKVHIFSNILDIDGFSINNILNIIDKNFKGTNYFVCVSPYVNDTRTSRLDIFMDHFRSKPYFRILKSIDDKKGEWKNGWTRVVRIFKAIL